MASSYKSYIIIMYQILIINSLFDLTLNVYLWILPSRLTQSFEVNENFMLSWVEIVIVLLNNALSLKSQQTVQILSSRGTSSSGSTLSKCLFMGPSIIILIANINRVCRVRSTK